MKVFEKAGHSRLVAYNDTLDDPIGMVHIRDLIAFMTAKAAVDPDKPSRRKKQRAAGLDLGAIDLSMQLSSTKIMREMLFVPPSMPALDLLEKMQATRIHLALVVDEYGGTDGLVSMEDIVEQIVGDIADEHDEDELPAVVGQLDGSFVADARASLDDVTAAVGVAFDVGDAAEEVDTLGGYLMTQVGRLPLRGELVPGPAGFEIEVLDSDPRRIKKVRIHRSKDRPIERDREGRRRYSAPDAAASPAIAPAGAEDAAKSPPTSHRFQRAAKIVTAIETRRPGFSITRLAHWIVLSWGWRRALVAFAAGAVSALAMAPFDAWPVLFFTFPILVWLVDGAAAGRLGGLPSAAIAGWWFGFGYFLAGLYWVGYAFLVDAKTFGWLLPFAVDRAAGGHGLLHRPSAWRSRACSGRAGRRGSSRSRSRSPPPSGCAAICSADFPGTSMATR